jgi:2-dehydro-3-deoxyglucarate aldolase
VKLQAQHPLRKRLRAKIRGRERTFAGWNSLGEPQITEIFSNVGFDFIAVDIEHSSISYEQTQRMIAASQGGNTACLPRIDSHSMEMIKRMLDAGADGIIVPMVDTRAQAEKLVEWTKYPPIGRRSFGVNRAQNYGFDFDGYVRDWNASSTLIVQIESKVGVDNVESILALDEIDGAMVGPYDISGALGVPGQLDHPEVVGAARRVVEACRRAGKGCGTHLVNPDLQEIRAKFQEGYTFLFISSDIFLIWKWAEQVRGWIQASADER